MPSINFNLICGLAVAMVAVAAVFKIVAVHFEATICKQKVCQQLARKITIADYLSRAQKAAKPSFFV